MSLIQIPKIEYITLDQFIPNWTEIIEEMDEKNMDRQERRSLHHSKGFDFMDCNHCLVGEAHHNKDDYSELVMQDQFCPPCGYFCNKPARQAIDQGHKTFQNFKLDLFTHMLEAHTELMIK